MAETKESNGAAAERRKARSLLEQPGPDHDSSSGAITKQLILGQALSITAFLLLVAVDNSIAAPIFYNTGVDDNSQQLPGGSPDPHYQLRQVQAGAYVGNTNWSPAIVMQTSIAWSQWLQPGDARWIYLADAANLGQDWGTYEYMTTFDLTGYDPATAVLAGAWALDQYGSIYLNGNLVTSLADGNWNGNLTQFNLTSGFVSGTNTLTFYVRHPDGGDGMIVSGASLTATALPQPSFMLITNAGIRTALFGFTISGSSNLVTVVGEACTNLTQPVWSPVFTNTLTNGPVYLIDAQWTNYPNRFYRLRSTRAWTRGDGWFVIGDSLSANVQSNGFSNSWFQQLTNYPRYSNQISALNCAYGATDAFNASNAAISCVIPAKTTGSNLCFAWIGANDYPFTSLNVFTNTVYSTWTNLQSNGFLVAAFTVIPRTQLVAGQETNRLQYNQWITTCGTPDYVIDVAARFTDPNSSDYRADHVHLTDASWTAVAAMVQNALLQGPQNHSASPSLRAVNH